MPADYDIHVDWFDDNDFTDPRDDISARIFDRGTQVSISYGRDQARAFAPLQPGRAQFELDNRSKDYSPENTASPLNGYILPARDVRIQARLNGATYGLLRGHLDDFKVVPGLGKQAVDVTCLDALGRLQEVRISTDLHQSIRTGEAIGVLLDAVGWDPDLRDLDPGATIMPWWWANNTDAYSALKQILDSEGPGALATVDIDGRIVFRDRHHRLTRTASKTVQATFTAGAAEPRFSELVYDHGWKEIVNHIAFAVPVRKPAAERTAVWSMEGRYTIADGQTIELAADASDPFISASVPVAGTDYELVSGAVEMWLDRTSGQSATLYIKAVGGSAIVANLQLRAYAVETVSTARATLENSTSVAKYGRRSWPSDRDPVFAGIHDARAIAAIILAQRAERLPMVTITVKGNDTRLLQQLTRDLSDRIRIVEPETGLDADFYIEQIEHTIGAEHVTRFGCERVATQPTDVLILGSATRGIIGTNRLGRKGLDDPSNVLILGSATQGVIGTNLLAH